MLRRRCGAAASLIFSSLGRVVFRMRFLQTDLADARLIEAEPFRDERGYFMRTFCEREFAQQGLVSRYVQNSQSFTAKRGAVRGMHFQVDPAAETKVVRCARGAIFDVIIDLRPRSPTYGRWQGFELTAENGRQLYIPGGFAHGFQTLTDDVEAAYLISEFYAPDLAGGVRYDDPAFNIQWPLPVSVISQKDIAWSDYKPAW
jgi:dTDP-4-dehydrorhamnose 3,5-epimerase